MYMLPTSRVRLGDLSQADTDNFWYPELSQPVKRFDDTGYTYDVPAPSTVPSAGSATDWVGAISSAIRTWGAVEAGKTQVELQRAQQTRLTPYTTRPLPTVPRYGTSYAPYQPGYSPFPGGAGGSAFFGIPANTWLLLLAAGGAVFFLMRK